MTMNSPLEQARTVVTLNNVGVALLENGYVDQALQVLFKMQQRTLSPGDVSQALKLAQQPPNSAFAIDVHVLCDNDLAELRDAAMYGPSSSMVFAVKLCQEANSVSPYVRAVCLHNLAAAYRCHYAETNDFDRIVEAERLLKHCHEELLVSPTMAKAPSYLWSICESARERAAEEQDRHVDVAFCAPKPVGAHCSLVSLSLHVSSAH